MGTTNTTKVRRVTASWERIRRGTAAMTSRLAGESSKAEPSWPKQEEPNSALARFAISLAGNLPVGVLLLTLILAGLPFAVWMDLRNLSERALRDQADAFTSVVDSIRSYYAANVVGRVLANPGGTTTVVHDYANTPGAIPIPATLSLELGEVIGGLNGQINFRFFSDYPFKNRAPHAFDAFERDALDTLRREPDTRVYQAGGTMFDREVRLIVPIRMGANCVACHNAHPDSPKGDWKVGDVRGIEEIRIRQADRGQHLRLQVPARLLQHRHADWDRSSRLAAAPVRSDQKGERGAQPGQ